MHIACAIRSLSIEVLLNTVCIHNDTILTKRLFNVFLKCMIKNIYSENFLSLHRSTVYIIGMTLKCILCQ